VSRSAFLVDPQAIGECMKLDHPRVEVPQDTRCNCAGRSVGTVDNDRPSSEIDLLDLDRPRKEGGVPARCRFEWNDSSHGARLRRDLREGVLDSLLLGERELPPLAIEELDSVILRLVVRGGDHRSQVGVFILNQEGDGRGRDHPSEEDIGSTGGEPGCERSFEHRPASSRVPPDDYPPSFGKKVFRGGSGKGKGEFRSEVLIRASSHTIRSEKATHHKGPVGDHPPPIERNGGPRASRLGRESVGDPSSENWRGEGRVKIEV